ncbi:hypothetical protein CVV26_00665 [Candidatus Kuenenbacteria bacterium HGW-Kuenenbacteria-1]|uniref:DUF4012 domain-containing protein n=1 Tax=Candidatus Kuenenbacteria bacterium HGW-Kuenenbacteria-1 TaxID=2013812 RepID=A0A2N1UPD9_9BACT|nr:MAG: hypothetical protein CVV26_00665 [Candidatus Kuenenbacteria bacterium HGW-Kuenenbacteria-1]
MKLKIRKIKEKENETLDKKQLHLVNLKILKKKKNIFSFLKYIIYSQKIIHKIKIFLQNLISLKKIKYEFSESKKALFFYTQKFFISFKTLLFKFPLIIKLINIKHLFNVFLTKLAFIENQCLSFIIIIYKKTTNKKHLNIPFKKELPLKSIPLKKIESQKTIIKKINKHHSFVQNLIFLIKKIFNIPLFFQQISHISFKKLKINPFKDLQRKFNNVNPIKYKVIFTEQKLFNKIKPLLIFILIAFIFVFSLYFLFLKQKSQNPIKETKKNIVELTNEIGLSNFILNQQQLNQIIKLLPANSKNRALFKAEKYLSESEKYLISALNKEGIKKGTPCEQITDFQNNLLIALPKIQIANYYLTQVKFETIPKQNRNEFNQVKIYLSKLENNIQEFLDYSKILLKILGHEKKQRYLIIFQNDDKIRPTGGSIEAFILVDVNQGIIKKVETQDLAFLEQQNNLIQPPYPLRLINSSWQAQDANWFLDFPTSAQKIISFYQKLENFNKKIDGVISLNANLISKILEIYGPTKTSQSSISDFIPELLNKILSSQNNPEQFLKTLGVLNESLSKKDIMFYFDNFDLQKDISKNNWSGEIKSINNGDYLAIVNANINGGSDKNIKQSVNLQTQILDDGVIINTVKITRTYLESDDFAKNLNYVRIYVPKGSTFLEIKGFKKLLTSEFKISSEETLIDKDLLKIQKQMLIDEATETRINQEFDKTVFGNWIEVESGKSATITFKYKLPFKFEDLKTNLNSPKFFQQFYKKIAKNFNLIDETLPYQLLIQKQSGSKDDVWKYSINLPINWQLVWQNFPIDFLEKDNQIEFNSFLNQDQLWTMLLKKL